MSVESAARAIQERARSLGETSLDPETPARFEKAWGEFLSGYSVDVPALLSRRFAAPKGIVACTGIEFSSVCEHHLLPFTGVADVAYLSSGTVFGASKLARVVDAYARRLQLQEKMAHEVASALIDAGAIGVLVRTKALHACMGCRGVKTKARLVSIVALGERIEGAW